MAKSIQRQAILSTILTYVGFGFGAMNLLLLQPFILSPDQFGLTKVVSEFSLLAVSFATLGSTTVSGKFFSFYKDYLPYKKNDLPFITAVTSCVGLFLTLLLLFILKNPIINFYGKKNPFFANYYWTIFPYIIFYLFYSFLEPYAWYAGKAVLNNMLKETVQRITFTCLLVAIAFKWIGFDGFVGIYSFSYFLPAVILFVTVRKANGLPWTTQISVATRRIKDKIITFSSFYYLTTLVAMCAQVAGTLFLAGLIDMANAGIFSIALYFSSVIEVPSRTIVGSAIPVLQGYWRVKNFSGLSSIYQKSAMTMMIVGLGLGGLIVVNLNDIILFLAKAKGNNAFGHMFWPVIILLLAKLVELSTGVNTYIIHTSNRWSFDLKSTMIYSVISLPLTYFLINHFGMLGAAFAALIAALFYNIYRCIFLYTQFKLQPFTSKNIELFFIAIALIVAIYLIPMISNLYIDAIIKSFLFIVSFGYLLLARKYSPEVVFLWNKWGGKITHILKK